VPSSGQGRRALVGGADIFDEDLQPWPEQPYSPLAAILNDYYWGAGVTGPPTVTEIPYAWLTYPVISQPTTAYTKAVVSQTGGTTGYATASAATVRRYGASTFTATLDTPVGPDVANLATFVTTYQATPRPRRPVLRVMLYNRTDAEILRVMRLTFGSRVRITGAPANWPPGGANFTVEGIHHKAAVDERWVDLTTSALIGTAPTTPGPWFHWGASSWGGTDIRPF
jgi:hypothetical protein